MGSIFRNAGKKEFRKWEREYNHLGKELKKTKLQTKKGESIFTRNKYLPLGYR